jgi:outer membrane protein insertion porin family
MLSNAVRNPRRNRIAVMLVGLLALATPVLAQQTGAPPAPRIRDIRVEGTTSASPSAVISFSGLRVGDVITADAIARSIRSLMERRLFSDVKIFAEAQTAEGVVVVIAVSEYPRVGRVNFDGHDELDDKEIIGLSTVRSGDIASPYEFDRTRARIKARYAEEGYLFTTVTASQRPSATDTGRVDVFFAIEEGPEVSIGEITFAGNTQFSESDLEGAMDDVQEKSWWQVWRSSKFDRAKLAEDRRRIEEFYQSRGFIDAEVVSDSIWIDPATGKANVHITVSEGNRVYLRSLAITGNEVYETPALMGRLNAEIGAPYNQVQLNRNVEGNEEGTDLRSLYLDNGYLTFRPEVVERRVGGDSMDVVIRISEGQQASIRYVNIAGNTKTKDKVIRRELFTRPGDTFSKQAIIRSLRTLANLNYFNPERLRPDVQPVDATTVDVTYEVEERPSDTFNASVGFSSQGLTGVLGVSFNNFSLLEPLAGGGGQILNFNWEFGSYVSTFSLGFTEPWLFDQPITLGTNIYYRNLESVYNGQPYDIRTAGGTLSLGRRLRWPDDYFRLDLTNRVLHNEINGEQPTGSQFRQGSEISHTLTLSRSSLDNPFFATVGSRFVFANTYAGLGDARFSKHELSFDFYSPLAQVTEQNSLVLYLNNEYGIVNDFGPLNNIAPTTFYNMGGTVIAGVNTIQLRGYQDNSIGPRSQPGRVYAKTTAELRFGLAMNPIPIYILGFAEAGNVWGTLREVNPFDLKRSVGVGLRVMVPPIGLLGFDYGYGFDFDVAGQKGGWRFHFQFGR